MHFVSISHTVTCDISTHRETHHADIESIQQVKGQGSDEVNKEPGRDVVNADGAGVVHHLTRRAHKGGSKVQHYVCRGAQQQQTAGVSNMVPLGHQ